MSAPVFGVPPGSLDALGSDGRVTLAGAEGHHAARVRRLRPGERLVVTDGSGRWADGVVAVAHRDALEVELSEPRQDPAPAPRLVVVQALPKGDRGETAMETLTEVGVDVVVPWAAERSVTRWEPEREERAVQRWRGVAREAGKQARRTWWPEVTGLARTVDVVERLRSASLAVVLDESARRPLAGLTTPERGEVVVVVGPEGGLSDGELAAFAEAGAVAVRLGPTVLRTSTAGTVAAGVLLAATARWLPATSP